MSSTKENCPNCEAHFIMSSLIEYREDKILLHCNECNRQFHVKNTEEQKKLLTGDKQIPTQIESLQYVFQLFAGDIIAFRRMKDVYEHHAIVTEVNHQSGDVSVVEFAANVPYSKGAIKKNKLKFDTDIATANAWVRRYMPLDCRPLSEIIKTANGYANNPKSMPGYDAFANNCQHLASLCKTGVRISEEGKWYEKYWAYVINGVTFVLSLIPNPYVKLGAFVAKGAEMYRIARKASIKEALKDKDFGITPESSTGDKIMVVISGINLILSIVLIFSSRR